jgi:hypothetical protein
MNTARFPAPEENNRPVAARLSLPRPRDPLFDDAAAKIGIELPFLGAVHGLQQRRVRELFLSGKPLKPLRFEDSRLAHSRIPCSP